MSFEDFDQQINDAAEKHHPAYREEAWGKMQALLDKHLPREDKRKRRALLLLPLLLLLTAGGFFVVKHLARTDDKVLSGEQGMGSYDKVESERAKPLSEGTGIGERGTGTAGQQPVTSNLKPETSNNPQSANSPIRNLQSANPQFANTSFAKTIEKPLAVKKSSRKKSGQTTQPLMEEENNGTTEVLSEKAKPLSGEQGSGNGDQGSGTAQQQGTEASRDQGSGNGDQQPVTSNLQLATSNHPPSANQKPVTRKSSSFSRSFAVTLNGGADMTAVRFSEPGQKRIITGIGLQYQFLKNFSLRTGVLQTHKAYGAKPKDYKGYVYTPSGYWLSGVSGDCKVYEIPVSIAFTFNPNKRLNIFAAVGATSMIMKKEDYVYTYKSYNAPAYNYRYGVKNRNEHLFATIDLSAGIQQNLNNRVFFRAEPYVSLPLHGVGLGNIKLKSAGVMLSAGIKPFAKK